jgi:archaellum component FlaC
MNESTPQFTIAELGAKFGAQLGQIFSELITAEKEIQTQRIQIQEITKTEKRLAEHVQDLEDELASLKSENFELQQMAKRQNASPEQGE